MNWTNVRLILAREVRDQLRDRRTLFMIAVLPMLLYPLLGMSFFQVAQFLREQPTRVLVVDLPAARRSAAAGRRPSLRRGSVRRQARTGKTAAGRRCANARPADAASPARLRN